jgi:hypothetical protein
MGDTIDATPSRQLPAPDELGESPHFRQDGAADVPGASFHPKIKKNETLELFYVAIQSQAIDPRQRHGLASGEFLVAR